MPCIGCYEAAAYPGTVYSGTASLQTSGAQNVEIAGQAVRFAYCGGEPSLTMMFLGNRCEIDWWDGTFAPGGPCVLDFGRKGHTVRVTDAIARFPNRERYGRYVDTSVIDVRVGGVDETARAPVLFHLEAATSPLPEPPLQERAGPAICPKRTDAPSSPAMTDPSSTG